MDDAESDDDSMGVQQILKEHDKRPTLTISAGVSEVFTSNAALTRTRPRHDVFGVADVGVVWTPRLSPSVEVNAGAHASIFRYARTPELDFENLSAGLGLTWAPPSLPGFSVFARYDLTQLLDSSGNHILTDNVFTAARRRYLSSAVRTRSRLEQRAAWISPTRSPPSGTSSAVLPITMCKSRAISAWTFSGGPRRISTSSSTAQILTTSFRSLCATG